MDVDYACPLLACDVQAARATRAKLALAYGRPQPEPARAMAHWDLLLQEARWLQEDFTQARPHPSPCYLADWSQAELCCSTSVAWQVLWKVVQHSQGATPMQTRRLLYFGV